MSPTTELSSLLLVTSDDAFAKAVSKTVMHVGFETRELAPDCRIQKVLSQTRFDCIIADPAARGISTEDLVRSAREDGESINPQTPILLAVDTATEEVAARLKDHCQGAFPKLLPPEAQVQLLETLKAIAAKKRPAVLVVEDELRLARMLEKNLLREGYVVQFCRSKDEARRLLTLRAYDCILVDLQFHEDRGEDVISLARQPGSDQKNQRTPIVIMSGQLSRNLLVRIGPRISDALVKPFDGATLLNKLRKFAIAA